MAPSEHESVTHWLRRLESDDDSAAQQQLWDRYFARLTAVARARLGTAPRREADEEDVALSVFESFFRAARDGRFPQLRDRTGLWPLLVKITARKAVNQIKRQNAQKRSAAREAPLVDPSRLTGREPTPQFALEVAEQVESLLGRLDDELRGIALMKLEGYENRDIAARLGIVERSVSRKLARIRVQWSEVADQSVADSLD